ncbi:response regulator transcription factor [Wenzhouxiangella sp. XN79A]|uniref:LytR/AlgR family response regulator transcription factor n=1 Tax=Wenzhouxiangella sp. XN79A TaxID=2724193 RepID=UPI00144A9526|nr:LytTR family DNA-binding domain-containing protein [Wenzhouxiangella sp. XN79A]NKI35798.1 response regulator transcription factor [Wenzhouxiangella sp. XN79A]
MTPGPARPVMVVDDEPLAVERLVGLLRGEPGVQVVGCESRPDRVLERCRELVPDLLLLDIEMPGIDGIELARALRGLDSPPAVIFVTAHDEYAVDAFDVAALDYLVKPVRRERLRAALQRFAARTGGDRPADDAEGPMLSARVGERRLRIPLDQVRALSSEDKCTVVHSTEGRALADATLKELEARHPEQFLRVHRAALVNRRHVRSLFRDAGGVERVTLAGIDYQPEVSRRNHAAVKRLLTGHDDPH